jgi:hypothetical protein
MLMGEGTQNGGCQSTRPKALLANIGFCESVFILAFEGVYFVDNQLQYVGAELDNHDGRRQRDEMQ